MTDKKIREFRIKSTFKDSIKRFININIPIIVLFIAYFILTLNNTNRNLSDYIHNIPPLPSEKTILLIVIFCYVGFALTSIFISYYKNKSRLIIFYDTFIFSNNDKYYLKNLLFIKSPSNEMKKYGKDFIILEFTNNKKIKFSNSMPRYPELKSFIKKYLLDRVDYSKLLYGSEL